MKFIISDRTISDESIEFDNPDSTDRSPLATKLFGFPWVSRVLIGPNFVSVQKQDWVDWDVLVEPLSGLIQEHIDDGYAVLVDRQANEESKNLEDAETQTIRRVLEQEVRPAVQTDGGDISFAKYENNVVYIHMKGACSGCPSSSYTLKMGIEARLKEVVPSIREVVAL